LQPGSLQHWRIGLLLQRFRRARTTQEIQQSQRAKFGKKDKIGPILPERAVFRFLRVDQATAVPVCQDPTYPKAPDHASTKADTIIFQ